MPDFYVHTDFSTTISAEHIKVHRNLG